MAETILFVAISFICTHSFGDGYSEGLRSLGFIIRHIGGGFATRVKAAKSGTQKTPE